MDDDFSARREELSADIGLLTGARDGLNDPLPWVVQTARKILLLAGPSAPIEYLDAQPVAADATCCVLAYTDRLVIKADVAEDSSGQPNVNVRAVSRLNLEQLIIDSSGLVTNDDVTAWPSGPTLVATYQHLDSISLPMSTRYALRRKLLDLLPSLRDDLASRNRE